MRLSVPKAFVTLRAGVEATPETARSIFEHCSGRLPAYSRVRRLEFSALPRTISGKIRRVELRAAEKVRRDNDERGTYEFWLDDFK